VVPAKPGVLRLANKAEQNVFLFSCRILFCKFAMTSAGDLAQKGGGRAHD